MVSSAEQSVRWFPQKRLQNINMLKGKKLSLFLFFFYCNVKSIITDQCLS